MSRQFYKNIIAIFALKELIHFYSMNCYLSRNYRSTAYAGTKAKTDIEQIMQNLGFKNIGNSQTRYTGVVTGFFATLTSMISAPFNLRKGDILVLQYPLKKYFKIECRLAHAKGAKVVVIIHDLGSFRRKKLSVKEEIKKLSLADYIIAHSDSMRDWLIAHGCKVPIGVLGMFDFLSSTTAPRHSSMQEKPFKVMYVGGLDYGYNAALYEMGENAKNWSTVLYGSGFEAEKALPGCNIDFRGYIDSDLLISSPGGDFGLVWYGSSKNGCEGIIGDYIRYIAPHKTSLYLRCEVPVIVWRGSGIAEFVKSEGIGLAVDSLDDIEAIFENMSDDDYATMKEKAASIGKRLASGDFTTRALNEAIKTLGGEIK